MKKEYLLIVAAGFFILAYVLDAVANPLANQMALPTPYHFFTFENISLFPFTTTSILLKALGVNIVAVITLASLGIKRFAKAGVLLVLSGLIQLYALQDVASRSFVIPLEWSLGFTLGGLIMFIPVLVFFFASPFERDTDSSAPPLDDQTPS